MGYNNRRGVVITVIALMVLIGVVSCIVIQSKPSGTPAPTSTEQVEEVDVVEDDDFICEWDDHPKEPECIGKTVPPKPGTVNTRPAGVTTTKPVVTPPKPRNTRR